MADAWEQQRVLQYIQRHGFTRITLQLPDDLLPHAASVAQELQQLLLASGSGAKVYVLADTSYNPLSIDEVAAAHVKADCVVHYGHASLHPVSRTPALCVLPRRQLDVQHTSSWLVQQLAHLHKQVQQAGWSSSQDSKQQQQQQQPVCVVCTDQCYLHQLSDLQQAVLQAYSGSMQLLFAHSASTELWPAGHPVAAAAAAADDTAAGDAGGAAATTTGPASQQQQQQQQAAVPTGGLMWQLPDSSSSSPDCMLWLGPPSSPALTHLQLSHASCPWLLLDPDGQGIIEGLSPGLDRLLKRRYYLVERARGATMVGLLVGTLGAAGYKTALEQLRRLAGEVGKKTYTLLMGKPNPAKLANFPEIEMFVMLADPQGLILDSKEYLNPIITPHEAFLAFTGREFDVAHYRLDFGDLLELQQQQAGGSGGAEGAGGGGAAAGANVGGNITDNDGSGDGEEDAGDSVQQLSAAAGALVIAGSGGHSTALSSNKAGQQVQVHSAAQYLTQRRTYKGLETPATGAEILPASVAVAGRTGRAAAYVDEPQQ